MPRVASHAADRTRAARIEHLGEPDPQGEAMDDFLQTLAVDVEEGRLCSECFGAVSNHRVYCGTVKT